MTFIDMPLAFKCNVAKGMNWVKKYFLIVVVLVAVFFETVIFGAFDPVETKVKMLISICGVVPCWIYFHILLARLLGDETKPGYDIKERMFSGGSFLIWFLVASQFFALIIKASR